MKGSHGSSTSYSSVSTQLSLLTWAKTETTAMAGPSGTKASIRKLSVDPVGNSKRSGPEHGRDGAHRAPPRAAPIEEQPHVTQQGDGNRQSMSSPPS